MIEYPTLITPLVTLFAGYFCTIRPSLVARLMTSWLPEAPEGHMNQSQAMAKYIRDNPENWSQKYPVFYRQIQFAGFGAYFIFAVSVLIILVKLFVPWAN